MKIGVIADTHLTRPSNSLIQLSRSLFKDVSLVLHAGDLTNLSVLDVFAGKRIVAVSGNGDSKIISEKLQAQQLITVNGYQIGLIHGWGRVKGIEDRLIHRFQRKPHCIVYGHTHRASNHIRSGILMFNPGAFSGTRIFKRNRSVGILTIQDGISGKIYPIE